MRLALAAVFPLWVGATLVLSEVRWFARAPLTQRLRPYAPGGLGADDRTGLLSVESFRDVVAPLSRTIGERLARLFGVSEELALKLERLHSPLDVTTFRIRQVGRMTAAAGIAAVCVVGLRPPPPIALLLLVAAPLLAFLLVEQQISGASAARQRRLFLELPVLAEQLAMLLSAGYSLGAALTRLSARGSGACAEDLRRVVGRIRQGLSEADALREWADAADVTALHRLVPVLALNREASDLGRLISDEARNIRRDVQRELVETMERRSQSVWIPVTVATLVPGVIFMAIPFIEALRLFSGS
ncbi:MAG TPA: type II secretion system F family protein [Acidimicrobiales bacterium]|nr:type II secretion system F family protein [Acidimicrobiales bacterium]